MLKLTILAMAISTTALTSTALADTKCSPDINVEYISGSGTSIKVTKIKYRLDGTSVWHTESVTNKVIDKSKDHTFKSQRLGSVAKGQKLDLRAVFKPDTGNDYGPEQDGPILSSSTNCENNVRYSIKVN